MIGLVTCAVVFTCIKCGKYKFIKGYRNMESANRALLWFKEQHKESEK